MFVSQSPTFKSWRDTSNIGHHLKLQFLLFVSPVVLVKVLYQLRSSLKMRNVNRPIVFVTLVQLLVGTRSWLVASAADDDEPTRRCDVDAYYYDQIGQGSEAWTSEELATLIRTTHTQVTPFYSSDPGNGDVMEALLEMEEGADFEDGSPSVQLFYLGRNVSQYPLDRSVWVPEHLLPVLYSTVGSSDFNAAYSDLHNLRAAYPSLHESMRGTTYFGQCPVCQDLVFENSDTCICGDYFQPPEHARGVVARTFLYMQLRYKDVRISNCHLEQLLAWHNYYPPTEEEKFRNLRVCYEWQGNRNPFVDFPELASQLEFERDDCVSADYGDYATDAPDNIFDPREQTTTPCAAFAAAATNCNSVDGDEEAGTTEPSEQALTSAPVTDHCASLLPGDIYFYVVQASPIRVGLLPLVELPEGLEVYLSDALAFSNFANQRTKIHLSTDYPDPNLLKLELDREMSAGNPFGYGSNMLFGDQWELISGEFTIRGNTYGGDELFVFCKNQQDQVNVLSALTTHGTFLDSEVEALLATTSYGTIALPEPHDYYVYNGPHYSQNESYQNALMNPNNWLGFELEQGTSGVDNTYNHSSSSRIRPFEGFSVVAIVALLLHNYVCS
eukprot:Nitzschia sp. Nitz4//scaffold307_size21646//551//2451//NITZ4_008593-RA/size21646-processed-gene-0.13-mRNA-1//1//CDS//3329547124//1075//frame0